jgi:hypothetical protein
MRKKRSQICFDISDEQKRFIKASAALRGISMNLWIHRAIQREIDRLNKYENHE